jgi:hypothetical protein
MKKNEKYFPNLIIIQCYLNQQNVIWLEVLVRAHARPTSRCVAGEITTHTVEGKTSKNKNKKCINLQIHGLLVSCLYFSEEKNNNSFSRNPPERSSKSYENSIFKASTWIFFVFLRLTFLHFSFHSQDGISGIVKYITFKLISKLFR